MKEDNSNCNHMIGIVQELYHNYEWPVYSRDDINLDDLLMIKFKYCPCCGEKLDE